MIVFLAVYLAGVVGLLCIIDRRMKAAQAAREFAFFLSSRRSAAAPEPLRVARGRAAEHPGCVS